VADDRAGGKERVWGLVSRLCVVVGVVSHAPMRRRPWAGCHDRDIRGPGCSVSNSCAAVVPAHVLWRARPGPAPLPVVSAAAGWLRGR
jgi:hypothetical protein